jgi:hypothetical protein
VIIHLVGGRDDGQRIDLDHPDPGMILNGLTVPLPERIWCHVHPANRAVYRMVRATPDECTYQIDVEATAAYRARKAPYR